MGDKPYLNANGITCEESCGDVNSYELVDDMK